MNGMARKNRRVGGLLCAIVFGMVVGIAMGMVVDACPLAFADPCPCAFANVSPFAFEAFELGPEPVLLLVVLLVLVFTV